LPGDEPAAAEAAAEAEASGGGGNGSAGGTRNGLGGVSEVSDA
jgi:hypothetical protein